MTMLAPIALPALFPSPPLLLVLLLAVPLVPLAPWALTTLALTPLEVSHLSAALASLLNLTSAQLYSAEPPAPDVTTCSDASVPSAMSLGHGRSERHSVPLPVELVRSGVRLILKLVALAPRPRLTKT